MFVFICLQQTTAWMSWKHKWTAVLFWLFAMSTIRCWPPATTIVLLTVQIHLTMLSYSAYRRLAIDKLCEHNSDFIDFRTRCKSVGEFHACSVWKDRSKSFGLLQVEFKLCQLFVVLIGEFTYSSFVCLSHLSHFSLIQSLFTVCSLFICTAFSQWIPHTSQVEEITKIQSDFFWNAKQHMFIITTCSDFFVWMTDWGTLMRFHLWVPKSILDTPTNWFLDYFTLTVSGNEIDNWKESWFLYRSYQQHWLSCWQTNESEPSACSNSLGFSWYVKVL